MSLHHHVKALKESNPNHDPNLIPKPRAPTRSSIHYPKRNAIFTPDPDSKNPNPNPIIRNRYPKHHHHHYHRSAYAAEARVDDPRCPRSSAALQDCLMPVSEPFLICCNQELRGRPGGLRHWALGRCPDLTSTPCFSIW